MESKQKISPVPGELPSQFADRVGFEYTLLLKQIHKKELGQFFTPAIIAKHMASFSNNSLAHLRILDPGCGTGILTCALVENLVDHNPNLISIDIVAYEIDADLISSSMEVLKYLKEWLSKKNISLTYYLCVQDFVLDNSEVLNNNKNIFHTYKEPFDIIISNPPYFKLSKEDIRTKAAKPIVSGQLNIYSIFMAISAKLLKPGGELIFITPRSFASGGYFKAFRKLFFNTVELEKIHLFSSRKDAFNRDNVLQETMILKAKREEHIDSNKLIEVSTSYGLKDIDNPKTKFFMYQYLIDLNSKEKILHIPTNENEELILNIIKRWNGTLGKHNIMISTGPVVAFRAWDNIHSTYANENLAPLFWLHNVKKMELNWPLNKAGKGQYIEIQEQTKPILIPNKNYIFLRRFSSKDDKSRLIAAPYFSNFVKADNIGVENKVNYIYRSNDNLARNEVVGLCALLNSDLFDNYFRTFNGNVNVSATELRNMVFPPLDSIKEIGNKIILSNNYQLENVNKIVNEMFQFELVST